MNRWQMWRQLWRRITTTRYARALEEEILPHMRAQQIEVTRQRAEINRLRAENRALLNSILGIAGVPPIVIADPRDDAASAVSSVGARHAVPGASARHDD